MRERINGDGRNDSMLGNAGGLWFGGLVPVLIRLGWAQTSQMRRGTARCRPRLLLNQFTVSTA